MNAIIAEDCIHRSYRRETIRSYVELTGWSLQWRRNVSPVKYELDVYIPEDRILHSHRPENFKSYIALTGWTLGFYIPEDDILHSTAVKPPNLNVINCDCINLKYVLKASASRGSVFINLSRGVCMTNTTKTVSGVTERRRRVGKRRE
jgi:hypothetical protein